MGTRRGGDTEGSVRGMLRIAVVVVPLVAFSALLLWLVESTDTAAVPAGRVAPIEAPGRAGLAGPGAGDAVTDAPSASAPVEQVAPLRLEPVDAPAGPLVFAGPVGWLTERAWPYGAALTGIVRDEAGEPLAGVAVSLMDPDGSRNGFGRGSPTHTGTGPDRLVEIWAEARQAELRVHTGADGRFAFRGLTSVVWTVLATAPGREPVALRNVFVDEAPLGLVLAPAARAELRVVAEGWAPHELERLEVAAWRPDAVPLRTGDGDDPWEGWSRDGVELEVARAGPGRFVVEPLGPLGTRVEVRGPDGWGTRLALEPVAPGEVRTVDVVLEPPLRLHGLVSDEAGAPAPGAEVDLRPLGPWPGRQVHADAGARFEALLPAGTSWLVSASLDGGPRGRSALLEAGASEPGDEVALDLVARRGCLLRVVCRDADGPRAARVRLAAERSRGGWMDLTTRDTDEHGVIEFRGLDVRRFSVDTVEEDGAEPAGVRFDAAGQVHEVVLELPTPARVVGRVLEAGLPVAGMTVRASGPREPSETVTADDGTWELELSTAFGEDHTRVAAVVDTQELAAVRVPAVPGGTTTADLVLETGALRVRVVDERTGAGLPDLDVVVMRATGPWRRMTSTEQGHARTDADGRAVFPRVPPSDRALEISCPRHLHARLEELPIAAGESNERTVSILPCGGVDGRVRVDGELPPDHGLVARVVFESERGAPRVDQAEVDADGRFQLRDPLGGTAWILVVPDWFTGGPVPTAEETTEVVLAPGEVVEIDVPLYVPDALVPPPFGRRPRR